MAKLKKTKEMATEDVKKKVAPTPVNTTDSQSFVIDTVQNILLSEDATDNSKLILIKSAPGSGKTTTIIEALRNILPNIDRTEDEKILLLAFNTKMKDELDEKIKKAGLDTTKLEIRTIHSLFFAHTWRFDSSSKNSETTFKLDFTKGFFNKKMIRQIIGSFLSDVQRYDDYSESILKKDRVFTDVIKNEINVSILYRYANAYYSSPYHISEINNLHHAADFFSKTDKSEKEFADKSYTVMNLILSDLDRVTITEKNPKLISMGLKVEEIFFFMFLQRIDLMARIKVIDKEEIVSEKTRSVQVEIVGKDGQITTQYVHDFKMEKKKTSFSHIFEVPHNYYYKKFMIEAFSDDKFLEQVFGKFRAIFIDEAQDNDMIFFQVLVHVLGKKLTKLAVAVGDPHQAIYGFKSPDHFDILQHGKSNSKGLKKAGIDVIEIPLGETFRFGRDISRFTNMLFPEALITGLLEAEGFVSNEALSHDGLKIFTDNIAGLKNVKAGIVCRTNNEAVNVFLELSKRGSSAVKLHSNIKSDFKAFVTKGISGIDDERVRIEIVEILGGKGNRTSFSYDDIMKSDAAKKVLTRNGYAQLIRFSKDDIEDHILSQDKKRKNIVITTAHQSKGAEFDYVVVAGDYFRRNLDNLASEVDLSPASFVKQETETSRLFESMFSKDVQIEATRAAPPAIVLAANLPIQDLIGDASMIEERNTLYVAITRAKKGVFFLEGNLFNSIKPIIESSKSWIDTERMAGALLSDNKDISRIFEESPSSEEEEEAPYEANSLFY